MPSCSSFKQQEAASGCLHADKDCFKVDTCAAYQACHVSCLLASTLHALGSVSGVECVGGHTELFYGSAPMHAGCRLRCQGFLHAHCTAAGAS